jgi:hypothetical protein
VAMKVCASDGAKSLEDAKAGEAFETSRARFQEIVRVPDSADHRFRSCPISDSGGVDHLRVTFLRPRKSALPQAKASFREPKECLGRKRRQGARLRPKQVIDLAGIHKS